MMVAMGFGVAAAILALAGAAAAQPAVPATQPPQARTQTLGAPPLAHDDRGSIGGFQLGGSRHKSVEACRHEMHTVIDPDTPGAFRRTCDN
jgi:hypothetical protein